MTSQFCGKRFTISQEHSLEAWSKCKDRHIPDESDINTEYELETMSYVDDAMELEELSIHTVHSFSQLLIFSRHVVFVRKVHLGGATAEWGNGVQLQFLTPLHEPRIYMAAPSGVPVTRVVAASQRYPDITPTYRLHGNMSDNVFFQIHAESGNITSRIVSIDAQSGAIDSMVVQRLGVASQPTKVSFRIIKNG
uniref:Uncharacterized protein n=1 Tax=Timema poppense TaxID=170557 RepID=A0A7R9DMI1_TIMPO|nr:unnamed protein product [Timema poppensis]